MIEDRAISGVTQTITATVSKVGTYTISASANGVTFLGTGSFSAVGNQEIVLIATGIPTAVGTNSFSLNTTPSCSFDRITAVNFSKTVLAQIGTDADATGAASPAVTLAQLNQIVPALTGITEDNITQYQEYIDANPDAFLSPATITQLQAMVTAVNTSVSTSVLAQIGTEADNTGTTATFTLANFNTIVPSVTGITAANVSFYNT